MALGFEGQLPPGYKSGPPADEVHYKKLRKAYSSKAVPIYPDVRAKRPQRVPNPALESKSVANEAEIHQAMALAIQQMDLKALNINLKNLNLTGAHYKKVFDYVKTSNQHLWTWVEAICLFYVLRFKENVLLREAKKNNFTESTLHKDQEKEANKSILKEFGDLINTEIKGARKNNFPCIREDVKKWGLPTWLENNAIDTIIRQLELEIEALKKTPVTNFKVALYDVCHKRSLAKHKADYHVDKQQKLNNKFLSTSTSGANVTPPTTKTVIKSDDEEKAIDEITAQPYTKDFGRIDLPNSSKGGLLDLLHATYNKTVKPADKQKLLDMFKLLLAEGFQFSSAPQPPMDTPLLCVVLPYLNTPTQLSNEIFTNLTSYCQETLNNMNHFIYGLAFNFKKYRKGKESRQVDILVLMQVLFNNQKTETLDAKLLPKVTEKMGASLSNRGLFKKSGMYQRLEHLQEQITRGQHLVSKRLLTTVSEMRTITAPVASS